jgi:hypothetical protein
MEYKGYAAGPIDFDAADGTFSGVVRPFNGKILLRTAPELHRKATLRAASEGLSLSQWISRQIEAA